MKNDKHFVDEKGLKKAKDTKRRKKAEFSHIGEVLEKTIKGYRKSPDAGLMPVWNLWNDAVGPLLAENTRPAAFKEHMLIVHVSSSTWLQQLTFLKAEIIKKVNGVLGHKLIHDITFKIGPL